MPPKKKKTQLKPIARGFATTSQPKKIVKGDAVEPESTIYLLRTDNTHSETDTDQVSNKDPSAAALASETSNTDLVEEQSLQFLVDKFQDKTEKEILRFLHALSPISRSHLSVEPLRLWNLCSFHELWLNTFQAIETERRFAQTLPHLDFESTIIDNILQLATSTESKGLCALKMVSVVL